MQARRIGELVQRSPQLLRTDTKIEEAVKVLLDTDLPALPVVDESGRPAGIFGEREFIGALFPRYVDSLRYAGFVRKSVEAVLEKRTECRQENVEQHMTREHVDVPSDFADIQLAETFLHHRVLVIPITEDGKVVGLVSRADFFSVLGERFLSAPSA